MPHPILTCSDQAFSNNVSLDHGSQLSGEVGLGGGAQVASACAFAQKKIALRWMSAAMPFWIVLFESAIPRLRGSMSIIYTQKLFIS
jgi:hypothetical protein